MTKISKNIKKFRTAKKLTQDEIAKQLFVTRQTVSSWESGRTQPDIETLCKLAELFKISVEELIYGKKDFANENEKLQKNKLTLIIIFSILASLLSAVGLILIFVTCWENFPIPLKTVFGFLPMLAGQVSAIFTLKKHNSSIAWREGASVLWCAGIAATIALIDSIYLMPTDFGDCLLIDTVLFLPVIYILDAVTPLTIYLGSLIYLIIFHYTGNATMLVITSTVLFAAGVAYVFINRKQTDEVKNILSLWISTVAGIVIFITNLSYFRIKNLTEFMIIFAVFFIMYICDKTESMTMPFRLLGLLGTATMTVVCVISFGPAYIYGPDNGYELNKRLEMTIPAVIFLAAVIAVMIIRRKFITKNKLRLIYCAAIVVNIISLVACISFFPSTNNTFIYLITAVSAFCASFALIAKGSINSKFMILNVGLLSTIALIIYVILNIIEIDMLAAGILLVSFGAMLFTVNFLLSKKIKKEEENRNA